MIGRADARVLAERLRRHKRCSLHPPIWRLKD